MARSLSPIPEGVEITDGKGIVTIFFRLAWQFLVDNFTISATAGSLELTGKTAAIATTTVFTPTSTGQYRVNWALFRTVDDGVASSGQITIAWTYRGVPKTELQTALTEAAGLSFQGVSRPIYADANAPITIAMAYASTTANKATFDLHANVEAMSS